MIIAVATNIYKLEQIKRRFMIVVGRKYDWNRITVIVHVIGRILCICWKKILRAKIKLKIS